MAFDGSIRGKEGRFVMEDHGAFENGAAISKLKILERSGEGALESIRGAGSYHADQNGLRIELDCEIEGAIPASGA
jgi:hypothetical protein